LARLGCALLLMAAMAWASRRISILDLGGKAFGRKSLHIYVGHLVLLYGLPWINGVARSHYRTLSLPEGFGAVLIVGSLTFGGVALMDLMQRRTKFVWPLLRFSSAVAVACLLLF
jgi:hypothetical protein